MNPATFTLLALSALLLVAIGFAIGWDLSVRRFRSQQTQLRNRYLTLRHQIEEITTEVSTDPVQFGIRTGRDYVIARLASLMAEINEESNP